MSEDLQKILNQVKFLEFSTKKLVNNLFAGNFSSAFKGGGMTFSDVREYVHGDDIRHISWPIAAKTGKPYVKTYEEEKELSIILAVDTSGSVNYGSNELKCSTIAKVVATLGFSAIKTGNKLGMVLFSDKVDEFIPPKKDKKNCYRIIQKVLTKTTRKTNLKNVLSELINIKKRSTIFIISDFMDKNFETELTLIGKKHDIIAIRIRDRSELQIPNIGLVNIKDAETGKSVILNTSNESSRQKYTLNMRNLFLEQKKSIRRSNIDLIDIFTNEDFFLKLAEYFKRRRRR